MWYAIYTSICYILILLAVSLIYQIFLVHKNWSEEPINDDEAYGGWGSDSTIVWEHAIINDSPRDFRLLDSLMFYISADLERTLVELFMNFVSC